jgi:quercetin dioxygenase-like cupin family protein
MKREIRSRSAAPILAAALLMSLALAQETLRPTVVRNVAFESTTMARPFTVHQQVLDLAPGAQSPVHMHGGPELVLVLQGEVTFLLADTNRVVRLAAGESYVIPAETFLQVRNDSNSDASFVVTFLLPEGATLTTPR